MISVCQWQRSNEWNSYVWTVAGSGHWAYLLKTTQQQGFMKLVIIDIIARIKTSRDVLK